MKVQHSKSTVKPRFRGVYFDNQNIHQEALKRESFKPFTLVDVPQLMSQLFQISINEDAYLLGKYSQQNLNRYFINQSFINQFSIAGNAAQEFLLAFEGVVR